MGAVPSRLSSRASCRLHRRRCPELQLGRPRTSSLRCRLPGPTATARRGTVAQSCRPRRDQCSLSPVTSSFGRSSGEIASGAKGPSSRRHSVPIYPHLPANDHSSVSVPDSVIGHSRLRASRSTFGMTIRPDRSIVVFMARTLPWYGDGNNLRNGPRGFVRIHDEHTHCS